MNTSDLATLNGRLGNLHRTILTARNLADTIARRTTTIEGVTLTLTPAQRRLLRDAVSVALANIDRAADTLLALTGKDAVADETVVAKATATPALLPEMIREPLQQLAALAEQLPTFYDANGSAVGPIDDTLTQQIAHSMATTGGAIKAVAPYIAALAGAPSQ